MKDYYQILGVSPSASVEEIRNRYRFLAQAFHPDRFMDPQAKTQAEDAMKDLNEAYSVLSNPTKRTQYDQSRVRQSDSAEHTGDQEADQEFDAALNYLGYLLKKWSHIFEPFPQNQQFRYSYESLVKRINFYIDSIRPGIRSIEHKQIEDRFAKMIGITIQLNISLGAEEEIARIDSRFTRIQLIGFATMPIQTVIFELLQQNKTTYMQNTARCDQLIELIGQGAYSLGEQSYAVGAQRARQATRSYTGTTVSTTAPKDVPESKAFYPLGFCQGCGRMAPVVSVSFSQNIGVIIMRSHRQIKGNLCAHCIEQYFWEFTFKTSVLGWWGVISFMVNPFIILSNIYNYLKGSKLRSSAKDLGDVATGYRICTVILYLLGFIAACLFFATVYLSSSSGYATTVRPTLTLRPTIRPTTRPTATPIPVYSLPTRMAPTKDPCYLWIQVDKSYEGRYVCVTGMIIDSYDADNTRVFYRFSKDIYALRLYTHGEYYYPDVVGNCVRAYGTVEVWEGVPFIDVSEELFKCP